MSSLAIRNYRLYFLGQLVSVTGTWMQTVAQSFLVLQLTHPGSALGLTIALRFAPLLLFGPWGGLIADRLDKLPMLLVTQTLSAGAGLRPNDQHRRLAAVDGLPARQPPWPVNVVDNPARQSMISELVPREQLSNAVTLNSSIVNMARVFGAAVGGVVTAVLGLALCFELNAASHLGVLITLVLMSRAEMSPGAPQLQCPHRRGRCSRSVVGG